MAHGFGGTRDSGLLPFAQAFAAAGLDALVFDYRNFGASTGEPRQLIDWRRHRDDYRAAIAYARGLEGVDPDRIVLWGTSYSGGHVVAVAADGPSHRRRDLRRRRRPTGLPLCSGCARYAGPVPLVRMTAIGVRDAGRRAAWPRADPGSRWSRRRGHWRRWRRPTPSPAFWPSPARRSRTSSAPGRCWTSPSTGRSPRAADLPCPTLVQIADRDAICPPAAAEKAAWEATGRAEVRRYPIGHFDMYVGEARERAIADQLHFLRRHLAVREREDAAA